MTTGISELIAIATLACEEEADEAIQLMDQRSFVSTVESIGEIQATDGSDPARVIYMLKVAAEHVDAARDVLRSAGLLHQDGLGWHCSTCGTSVEHTYAACWSCGTPHAGGPAMEMPVAAAAAASGCSTGSCGCGTGGCGTGAGGLFDIQMPPEWDAELQRNDRLAQRAFVAAAVSVVLPPAVLVSSWLIGKTMIKPLSPQGMKQFYLAMGLSAVAVVESCMLWNWQANSL